MELDIEIWPTSIVVPAGYRVALTIRGKDYEHGGAGGDRLAHFKNELRGCGPFLHDDPRDRPPDVFGGVTTLHFGKGREAYLLLPIVPPNRPSARLPRARAAGTMSKPRRRKVIRHEYDWTFRCVEQGHAARAASPYAGGMPSA